MSAEVVVFMGVIHTPYQQVGDCPRQPWTRPALSTIELDPDFADTVEGLSAGVRAHVLWGGAPAPGGGGGPTPLPHPGPGGARPPTGRRWGCSPPAV